MHLDKIITVPILLVCYVISVIVIFALCNWWFDRPENWPYVIPIITSLFSIGIVAGIAEEKLSDKAAAKIAIMIIAAFWVLVVIADVTGTIGDIVNAVSGKDPEPDALDIFVTLLDGLLNAKIFAVVSCLMAASENN